ncbi:UDP-galactopyranose mutase [Paenibacillus popilliae ATCC 14706]|uniref:UDP-galactopyranose mutase n=1 Tax=Paenibacillus popilliae ATCC 14706 TaxID=1212764 RepID=M9LD26_PAEPP|nr:UDP-galactopyranose mutase [Paenibacillus popilliae ATCC 14706]
MSPAIQYVKTATSQPANRSAITCCFTKSVDNIMATAVKRMTWRVLAQNTNELLYIRQLVKT